MIYFQALLAILATLPCTLASEPHSSVQQLTDSSFDSALKDPANGLWFLKFYAPWCGHCKKLEPILDEVAPKLYGKMAIGKVDCTQYKDLCKKFKVKGFPTIKFYRDDEFFEYPSGDRDADSIIAFAEKMSASAIVPISSHEDALKLAKGHPDGVAFIAYDHNAKGNTLDEICLSTPALQAYYKVARQQQAYDSFGLIMPSISTEEIQKMDVGSATKTFIAKVETGMDTKPYRGDIEPQEVLEFVRSNNVGLVTQIGSHNFKSMGRKGRPLAIAVTDPDNEQKSSEFVTKLKDFAKNGIPGLTGKYYFCYLDGKKWEKFIKQFDLVKSDLPEFFALDVPSKTFWRNSTISKETDFQKFLHLIHTGKMLPQKQVSANGNRFLDFLISILEPIAMFVDDHVQYVIFGILLLIPFIYYVLVREGNDEEEATSNTIKDEKDDEKKDMNGGSGSMENKKEK